MKLDRAEGQIAARAKESVGAGQGNVGWAEQSVGGRRGDQQRGGEAGQERRGRKRCKGCQQDCHTVIPSNRPFGSHGARQRTASDTSPGWTDAPISTPVAKRPATSPNGTDGTAMLDASDNQWLNQGAQTSVGGKASSLLALQAAAPLDDGGYDDTLTVAILGEQRIVACGGRARLESPGNEQRGHRK